MYYLNVPLRLTGRITQLFFIFGPAIILAVPLFYYDRGLLHSLLFWCLRRAGATFTKLGQWASTRPDIIPGELCNVLSALHTRAPTHGMNWNRHVLKCEFGRELEDIFVDFDPEPIGSGTVAQVHRAKIKATGEDVAVKICHPRITEKINDDLLLMKVMAELISPLPIFKWLNLGEELGYFSKIMRQQLDLRHEGYTLAHFARNFVWWRSVHIPSPVYPFISQKVLVETFAAGTTVGAFAKADFKKTLTPVEAEVWSVTCKEIATIGLQSFLQMLLWDNFVHADLHPGNILVRFKRPNGTIAHAGPPTKELVHQIVNEDLSPQIVYLDTGLITQLSRKDFGNFNDLFIALVLKGDGYKAGQLVIERSPVKHSTVIDPEGFCREMDQIVRPIFKDISMELGRFAIGPVLFRVFELVRAHHVRLDGSFTNLIMSFVCVEGLGRQLAPDLNLIPYLGRAALQYLVTNVAHKIV